MDNEITTRSSHEPLRGPNVAPEGASALVAVAAPTGSLVQLAAGAPAHSCELRACRGDDAGNLAQHGAELAPAT